MSVKTKIIVPVVLLSLALLAKFVLWDYVVSSGKRSGNLVKLSEKGKVIKTWEGTLDLGSGDKLTFDFSVKDEKVAKDMEEYMGEAVSIEYVEHFLAWPRETKYDVIGWNPKVKRSKTSAGTPVSRSSQSETQVAADLLNKTLFCSTIGALYQNQELYKGVKEHLKSNNLYLYRQIEKCNH